MKPHRFAEKWPIWYHKAFVDLKKHPYLFIQ